MTIDLIVDVPDLTTEELPGGRLLIHAESDRRDFTALLHAIPGRLDYVKNVGAERKIKGWAAIETDQDVVSQVGQLLVWTAGIRTKSGFVLR